MLICNGSRLTLLFVKMLFIKMSMKFGPGWKLLKANSTGDSCILGLQCWLCTPSTATSTGFCCTFRTVRAFFALTFRCYVSASMAIVFRFWKTAFFGQGNITIFSVCCIIVSIGKLFHLFLQPSLHLSLLFPSSSTRSLRRCVVGCAGKFT